MSDPILSLLLAANSTSSSSFSSPSPSASAAPGPSAAPPTASRFPPPITRVQPTPEPGYKANGRPLGPLKRPPGRPKGSRNKGKSDEPVVKRPRGRPKKIRSEEEIRVIEQRERDRAAGLIKRGRPPKKKPEVVDGQPRPPALPVPGSSSPRTTPESIKRRSDREAGQGPRKRQKTDSASTSVPSSSSTSSRQSEISPLFNIDSFISVPSSSSSINHALEHQRPCSPLDPSSTTPSLLREIQEFHQRRTAEELLRLHDSEPSRQTRPTVEVPRQQSNAPQTLLPTLTPFTTDTVFEPFSPLSLNFDFASLFRDIESLPALRSSNGNAIRRPGSALGRKRPELKPTSGGAAEPQTVSHPPLPTEFFDYSSLLREIEAYPQTRRPRAEHPPHPVQTTVDTALLMQPSNDPSSPTMTSFDTTWISPAPDGGRQRQSDNAHHHQDAATAALFPPDFDINQLLREIEEYPIRKHGQPGPSPSAIETVQNHPKSFVTEHLDYPRSHLPPDAVASFVDLPALLREIQEAGRRSPHPPELRRIFSEEEGWLALHHEEAGVTSSSTGEQWLNEGAFATGVADHGQAQPTNETAPHPASALSAPPALSIPIPSSSPSCDPPSPTLLLLPTAVTAPAPLRLPTTSTTDLSSSPHRPRTPFESASSSSTIAAAVNLDQFAFDMQTFLREIQSRRRWDADGDGDLGAGGGGWC